MSEDSDYTSDVNYPVGQHANCSASQYRGNISHLSEDDSRQNSYEQEYPYESSHPFEDVYNDGRRSDTESEPLYYNSRPRQDNYRYRFVVKWRMYNLRLTWRLFESGSMQMIFNI